MHIKSSILSLRKRGQKPFTKQNVFGCIWIIHVRKLNIQILQCKQINYLNFLRNINYFVPNTLHESLSIITNGDIQYLV